MGTRVVFAKTQKTNITLMSERTTIGGTVYEVVGSSSSNLLLKCNGTARIQWGNKLIDLIKNGKIASTYNTVENIFIALMVIISLSIVTKGDIIVYFLKPEFIF